MTDDIKTLTTRLAEEPSSLAFLDLGEALRRRGKLDAAYKVARGGLSRYPALADAHDLLGRILGIRAISLVRSMPGPRRCGLIRCALAP